MGCDAQGAGGDEGMWGGGAGGRDVLERLTTVGRWGGPANPPSSLPMHPWSGDGQVDDGAESNAGAWNADWDRARDGGPRLVYKN